MRASWDPDLAIEDSYLIKGDRHHHLVHVIRIEEGEELLLLNGQGLLVTTTVEAISKKELRLRFLKSHQAPLPRALDVVLGVPKKEALELCLKQATELGIRRIYLVRSAYSQTRVPEPERLQSLLVSGLEQSNAPYLPEALEADWNDIPWATYTHKLMLDSQSGRRQNNDQMDLSSCALVVGPEGGFSPQELHELHQIPHMEVLQLPTPILRTPTALATGAGILLGRLIDR